MEEEVDNSNYRAYQHFISNSDWDYQGRLKQISFGASELLNENKTRNNLPVGYIVGEIGFLKKGTGSVGVANQYAEL
jgi:SRSO17 transposase